MQYMNQYSHSVTIYTHRQTHINTHTKQTSLRASGYKVHMLPTYTSNMHMLRKQIMSITLNYITPVHPNRSKYYCRYTYICVGTHYMLSQQNKNLQHMVGL